MPRVPSISGGVYAIGRHSLSRYFFFGLPNSHSRVSGFGEHFVTHWSTTALKDRRCHLSQFGGNTMKSLTSIVLAFAISLAIVGSAGALSEDGSNTYVKKFGAAGDGKSDDTYAFQQAIAQVKAGGTVILPDGNYTLSDTIVITKPVNIVGTGFATQIYNNNNKTLFRFVNVNNSAIRDLYLGSNSTQQGVSLIEFVNSHHNQVNNVTMLGGYYGLHLQGSLLNTIIDLRSGTNFGGFFAPTSTNNTWIMGERYNNISANANTFIAPVLEGGVNGIVIADTHGEGSLNITGGTIEGVSGTGLTLQGTFLPSTVAGVHFEANVMADIVLQAASNVRLSAIVSDKQINLMGDSRNVTISDSIAQNISIDMGDRRYPLGTGAKRIILQNITTCWAAGPSLISPTPTPDPNFGMPDGPSSPVIPNPQAGGAPRLDIIYTNIGNLCGGG
jgi:hypothetical protein